MSVVSRLIGLWMSGKVISSRASLFQQLLAGVAAIAVYVVFAAMMAGLLLLGIFYFLYQTLVFQGFSDMVAALIVGACLLILLLICLALAWNKWLRVRELPRRVVMAGTPLNGHMHDVVESFFGGFMRRDEK